MIVKLFITKNAVPGRNAGLAMLEFGRHRKAITKCFTVPVTFSDLFKAAIANLKTACEVHLFTNCKAFDVNCAVMAENAKGLHQVIFKPKEGAEKIDWLKMVAYEIALNHGADDFLLKEAMIPLETDSSGRRVNDRK